MTTLNICFVFLLGMTTGGLLCGMAIAYIESHSKTFTAIGVVGFAIGLFLALWAPRTKPEPQKKKNDAINVFVYKWGKKLHACDHCASSAGKPRCVQLPKAILHLLEPKWCETTQCKRELQKHL